MVELFPSRPQTPYKTSLFQFTNLMKETTFHSNKYSKFRHTNLSCKHIKIKDTYHLEKRQKSQYTWFYCKFDGLVHIWHCPIKGFFIRPACFEFF